MCTYVCISMYVMGIDKIQNSKTHSMLYANKCYTEKVKLQKEMGMHHCKCHLRLQR